MLEINQYNKNGKYHGYWEHLHSNGKIHCKGFYVEGKATGLWEWFTSDGNRWLNATYLNGVRYGIWEHFFYGKLVKTEFYV